MYFIDALISLWLCSPPPPLNDLIVSQLFRQRWIKPPGGLTTLPLSGDSGHPLMGCCAEALSARHLALNKDTRQLSTSYQNSGSAFALHYSNNLKRWKEADITISPREDSQRSKASRFTTTAASPLAPQLPSENMAAGAGSAPQGLRWFFLQRSPTNTKI